MGGANVTAKRRQQGLYYVTREGLEIDLLEIDALEGVPYPQWPGLGAAAAWLAQEVKRAETERVATRDAAWANGLKLAINGPFLKQAPGYNCEECLAWVPAGQPHPNCTPSLLSQIEVD